MKKHKLNAIKICYKMMQDWEMSF